MHFISLSSVFCFHSLVVTKAKAPEVLWPVLNSLRRSVQEDGDGYMKTQCPLGQVHCDHPVVQVHHKGNCSLELGLWVIGIPEF